MNPKDANTADDAVLARQAAAGDAGALTTLLQRHGPAAAAQIHRQIGSRWQALISAEDVMQVTYLEAFLRIGQWSAGSGTFGAWLQRAAENNLLDAIRHLQRRKRAGEGGPAVNLGGDGEDDRLLDQLDWTTTTPSRNAGRDEIRAFLEAKLAELPQDYADVIRLYDLEGLGIDAVAERLKRSSGAIYMLRARAHDRLRDLLGNETQFFSRPR